MRISDWSSDVCSSDLRQPVAETLPRFDIELPVAQAFDALRQCRARDAGICGERLTRMPLAVGEHVDQREQLGFAQRCSHRPITRAFSNRCSLPCASRTMLSRCFQTTSPALALTKNPVAITRLCGCVTATPTIPK